MERISCTPRENYREIVESRGSGFTSPIGWKMPAIVLRQLKLKRLKKRRLNVTKCIARLWKPVCMTTAGLMRFAFPPRFARR